MRKWVVGFFFFPFSFYDFEGMGIVGCIYKLGVVGLMEVEDVKLGGV